MIRGFVNTRREAIVPLRLRGPNEDELTVDTVVDSGFTASLSLPIETIETLALSQVSDGGAVLADGTFRQFAVYSAEVEWNGNWRPVLVSGIGDEILMGMRLLAGHELKIAVTPGSAVEIIPLPG